MLHSSFIQYHSRSTWFVAFLSSIMITGGIWADIFLIHSSERINSRLLYWSQRQCAWVVKCDSVFAPCNKVLAANLSKRSFSLDLPRMIAARAPLLFPAILSTIVICHVLVVAQAQNHCKGSVRYSSLNPRQIIIARTSKSHTAVVDRYTGTL